MRKEGQKSGEYGLVDQQDYLKQGFFAAGDYEAGADLEKLLSDNIFSAVYVDCPQPEVHRGLKIEMFSELRGTGFRLPDGSILIIHDWKTPSRVPKGWLFKIEI
ncbi:MAG: hypothetical protein WCV92_04845 [Candidatus Buchananbacteria bacterium]